MIDDYRLTIVKRTIYDMMRCSDPRVAKALLTCKLPIRPGNQKSAIKNRQ